MEPFYNIRPEVLNMTLEQWKLIKQFEYKGLYQLTITDCLGTLGLISGKSSLYNDEEKEFFERLYFRYRS